MTAIDSLSSADSTHEPQKFRVLIVEDDPHIARLVQANLRRINLECRIAPDGLSGIEEFKRWNPHLVLTDIMMPGMNGDGVCIAIRKMSMVPIIMMTAADTSTAQLEAFKAGADDYIAKPFDPNLLAARIIAHLRRVYRYDADAYGAGGHTAETPRTDPAQDSDGKTY